MMSTEPRNTDPPGAPPYRDARADRPWRAAERIWRAGNTHPAVLLLRPLSTLFELAVRTRRAAYEKGWQKSVRAPVPVISVGNLTVGGTGKTPFTRWLVSGLLKRAQRPAILHGGYAADEPALHRTWHPGVSVYAGRDRIRSARAAAAGGATVLVLDDGRQHLRLARDLDIVLVAADSWAEPRRTLPAGAWREPLSTLRSAGVTVITRKAASPEQAHAIMRELAHTIDQAIMAIASLEFAGCVQLETGQPTSMPAEALVVCGIANPEALVGQLEQSGTRVNAVMAFSDHHEFSPDDLQEALHRAGTHTIVVTEKDAVKIARLDPSFRACVLQQRVVIEYGERELWAAVDRVLA
jgi:tetraacyldisaccharide 4'-kinase